MESDHTEEGHCAMPHRREQSERGTSSRVQTTNGGGEATTNGWKRNFLSLHMCNIVHTLVEAKRCHVHDALQQSVTDGKIDSAFSIVLSV